MTLQVCPRNFELIREISRGILFEIPKDREPPFGTRRVVVCKEVVVVPKKACCYVIGDDDIDRVVGVREEKEN